MRNPKPEHIAIIMDGNRRWAKENNTQTILGHKKGLDTAREICIYCNENEIKYLTLYAFSIQNWSRSSKEIDSLFALFLEFFNQKSTFIIEHGMKFNPIGRIDALDPNVKNQIYKLAEKTKNNIGTCIYVAINYGGREEIIDAIKKLNNQDKSIKEISEEQIKQHTYLPDCPDPELVIRTGGISRISNYLLWHIAYSEILISEKYWPEFKVSDFQNCINEYMEIDRKFGGASNE